MQFLHMNVVIYFVSTPFIKHLQMQYFLLESLSPILLLVWLGLLQ